jgi:hypothetical protein
LRVVLLPVITLESNRLDCMLEASSTDKTLDAVRPLDRSRAGREKAFACITITSTNFHHTKLQLSHAYAWARFTTCHHHAEQG